MLSQRHGCLSRWDGKGEPRYAFVHGNWALANSAGGRFCGVDSEMQILLTRSETRDRLPLGARGVTVVDVEDPAIALESSYAVETNVASHNLAYVIYTSGSTGKPKGVMLENRNVVNFFTGMDRAIGCAPGVWLAVTSFSFDISVLELLWTLGAAFGR